MRSVILAACLALAAGCASAPERDPDQPDRHLITREEIEASGEVTAGRVIRRLRPHWFATTTSREGRQEIVYYLNGLPMAGVPIRLSAILIEEIDSLTWMSGPEAAVKLPAIRVMGRKPGAVIFVWTRSPGGG
jgi:hypothetical protein